MWPRTLSGERKHRQNKRSAEVKLVLDCIRQLRATDSSVVPETEILEFGAGDGFQIPYLQTLGHVIACDLYESDNVKNYTGIEFVKCNITAAPFESNEFDIIFSNHVIEHIENLDGALQELRRIGKANCLYAFSVPTALWLLLSVPADYYNKGTKLMKRLLGIINKNDAQITITKGKRLSSSLNARQQAENRSIPGTLRLLLPSGHGCYTGFLDCLRSFRVKHWRDLFQSHGFRVLRIEPLLLYGASEWPIIPTNRFLTRFGLRSSVLFIMEQIDRPTGFNSRFKDFRNGTARQSNTVSRSESTPGKEVRTCQR